MIDGKPDWFRLSGAALADLLMMNDEEQLFFIKSLLSMYEHALESDFIPEKASGFLGRAIDRQYDCFRAGVNSYMKLVTANPSGKPKGKPMATPMGKQTEKTDNKADLEEIRREIRTELLAAGYTLAEIDSAISSVENWDGIENRSGYVVQIIRNHRKKPVKTVSAQQYAQRSYDDEEEAIWARQRAEIEAMKQEASGG